MGRLARSVVKTKLVFMCNDLIWCYQLQPPQSGLSLFACRVELFSRRTCRVSATRTDMRFFFQELLWVHTLVFGQSVSPTHVLPYPRRRARRGRALNDLTYPESSAPGALCWPDRFLVSWPDQFLLGSSLCSAWQGTLPDLRGMCGP